MTITASDAAEAVLSGNLPDFSEVADSVVAAEALTDALELAHDLILCSGMLYHPTDVVRFLGDDNNYTDTDIASLGESRKEQTMAYVQALALHFAEANVARNTAALKWLNGEASEDDARAFECGVSIQFQNGELHSATSMDTTLCDFFWFGSFEQQKFEDLIMPLLLISARVVHISRKFEFLTEVSLSA